MLFMQTRYWVRPLLLVSTGRRSLSLVTTHYLSCFNYGCWAAGLWLLTSLRHLSLRLTEINFPSELCSMSCIFPLGHSVVWIQKWDERGWVTAVMSRDASHWPRLISGDMFWIFWQCCPGLWLHSWPGRYHPEAPACQADWGSSGLW